MKTRRELRRRLRTRRVRAVLAAGVVLGLGTVATLAAWTDTEIATGSFGASVFGTESASQGTPPSWTSNTTAPGASLAFNATAMSPGASAYAWLNVRTTASSTVGGTVVLTSATASGALAPALQYRAVRMSASHPTATCNATAFTGTPVYVAGAAGTYLAVTQVASPAVSSTIGAAGAQIGYCFEVRIQPGAANSMQGQFGSVTWTFTATSAS